jgi:peptide/nickel transport system ATP-binding protein
MPSVLIQVESLSLASDHEVIIDNLSFSIDHGEIVALTGKSGSGKTSIGMAILGMLPQGIRMVTGSIHWFGTKNHQLIYPRDKVQWRRLRGTHIGFIQQDVYGIFDPVIQMGKQMSMIIRERTERKSFDIEGELRSKMEEVGIKDIDRVLRSYPHQLSGGQLQRCQICLSIVIQPSLIIADEPTSAIDKIIQVEILDLLAYVRQQYQMAILCITMKKV